METENPRSPDVFGYNAKWGYYLDRETELYVTQHRMYDASTGRFLNRDPIGYAGGVNLYGYCGQGPVGSADPSGLQYAGTGFGAPQITDMSGHLEGMGEAASVVGPLIGGLFPIVDGIALLLNPGDPMNWLAVLDPTPVSNAVKGARTLRKGVNALADAEKACDPVHQVQVNRRNGLRAEKEALDFEEANLKPGQTLDRQQYVRIPGYKRGRTYDGIIRESDRAIEQLEVKHGGSHYGGKQKAKDKAYEAGGGPPTRVIRW